jgi:hypothetical protein
MDLIIDLKLTSSIDNSFKNNFEQSFLNIARKKNSYFNQKSN